MKKNVILAICLFAVLAVGCEKKSNKQRMEELKDEMVRLENSGDAENANSAGESSEVSANEEYADTNGVELGVGTYEFVDKANRKIILKLNADMTATIEVGSMINYGSWEEYSPNDGLPLVKFNADELPTIQFPGGEESCTYLTVTEHYIYESYDNVRSKNPRKRLSCKKIK